MVNVISVANQKGGVGKTTTTINLAASIADRGYRVLIVDIDPQGNATSGLGIEKSEIDQDIYNVLIDEVPIQDTIHHTSTPKLDMVPATINLSGAETELISMMARETRLKSALDAVSDKYDFVFIDCPPSLGLITVNALTATDSIIIPIQCEYFALVGLGQLMNTVRLIKQHLNPNLDIEGVLMTMKDNRSNLVTQVASEIQKYFGNKVYKTTIPRNIRLAEAPSHGLPIYVYDPKAKGAQAYEDLSKEFLSNQTKQEEI